MKLPAYLGGNHEVRAARTESFLPHGLHIDQTSLFDSDSNIRMFKHIKRGHCYRFLGEAVYDCQTPAFEDDLMVACYANGFLFTILSAKCSESFSEKEGVKYKCTGKLQCCLPVEIGVNLVLYQNIADQKYWYRPAVEFFDPIRFTELQKT